MGNKNKDENLITLDDKIKTNEIKINIEDNKKGENNIEGNQNIIKTEEKIEVIENNKIIEKEKNENLIIEKIDENIINKEEDKNSNLSKNINKEKERNVGMIEGCEEYLNSIYYNFVDEVSDGLILYYTNYSK